MLRRAWLLPVLLGLVLAACDGHSQAASGAPPAGSTPAAAPGRPEASSLGTRTGLETRVEAPAFAALPGAVAAFGQLSDAVYRIEMPDRWNGELVLWAHGFRGFDTTVFVSSPDPALRRLFIEQGYAWAASSYSENGYVPGIGADDTLALKRHFEEVYGRPKRTYVAGESMGGNVVALALEHHGEEYDGALSLCGALGGEEQIDYLLSWAMLAEYLAGVELPIGQGQPAVTDAILHQVLPALGLAGQPTAAGRQFTAAVRQLTGGPRPFFAQGLALQYVVNFGLLMADGDRQSLAARAATNEGVHYRLGAAGGAADEELNAGVRRLAPDASARDASAHPDAVPTSGAITRPLLALHTTGDLFVPISQEQSYRRKAEAAGAGDLLVQRAIRAPGHCQWSEAELTAAWNDLRAWVETGRKPAGDDLSGSLANAGRRFTMPLRPGDPGGR
jgi:alpha-beta hydrolase superfamily lysophospholipase